MLPLGNFYKIPLNFNVLMDRAEFKMLKFRCLIVTRGCIEIHSTRFPLRLRLSLIVTRGCIEIASGSEAITAAAV